MANFGKGHQHIWNALFYDNDPVSVTFNTLQNPTTVTHYLRKPDGTLVTTVVNPTATGHYRITVDYDQAGTYRRRWRATGTFKCSQPEDEIDEVSDSDMY
jgi:hypothetical protein